MAHEQNTQTGLAAFVARHRNRLVGTVVGGIALACVAHSPSQNEAAVAADSLATGIVQSSDRTDAIRSGRTPDQAFRASAAAIVSAASIDDMQEAISDRRARLENAAKELENLEDMVAAAEGLDASDREEAITSALLIYNEALAGTEFEVGMDLTSERARKAWKEADSSTDLLMALHPMQ